MKIFNIEEKGNKKENVCYIQLKDLEYLKENNVELEVFKDINKYMYVFSKDTLKSFIRIDVLEDIKKIKEFNGRIIDFSKIRYSRNADLSPYFDELVKERDEIEDLYDRFTRNTSGVWRGHLSEYPLYQKILVLKRLYNNKLEDLIDIKNFLCGHNTINLPQEPFYSALLARKDNIALYGGINPNEYIVLYKDGAPISDEIRDNLDLFDNKDISNNEFIPDFIIDRIMADLRTNHRNYVNESIEYDYSISEDNRYLVIRTNRVKKHNKVKVRKN